MSRLLDHRLSAVQGALAYGIRPTSLYSFSGVERKITIVKDKIPFLSASPEMDEPICLDFDEGCFTLFVSPPGAGKTFALRGLVGDLWRSGYNIVDVGSVDNDLYWSRKPLQEKFWRFLPPWRQPMALPIKAYMPFYLRKRRNLKEGMQYGQIDLCDLEYQDITKNLFKQDESKPFSELISTAWGDTKPTNVDELIARFGKTNSYETLLAITGKRTAFSLATVQSAGRRLINLKEVGVLGRDYPIDMIEDLKNDFIPVLCFQAERQMEDYHSMYISGLIRQVFNAKIRGKLKKRLVFVFDDMGSLACPSRKNTSSKDVIINDIISLGRKKGVYGIGAVQTVSQVPDEILAQVKNFVFFGKISGEDLTRIAKTMNTPPSSFRNLLYQSPPKQLEDGRRSCVLWSKSGQGIKGYAQPGWIPSPCSYHKEQD